MKVGPDTGSRPTNESHLNGGVPRSGLLKAPTCFAWTWRERLQPLADDAEPVRLHRSRRGSPDLWDVGLSFSPEKTQIELACDVAAVLGVNVPGGPLLHSQERHLHLHPQGRRYRPQPRAMTSRHCFLPI